MRLITVKAPAGSARAIAALAFRAGAKQVAVRQETQLTAAQQEQPLDVVDVQTATPKARQFIEDLLVADFYDPDTFAFTVRHPETLFADAPPKEETQPIVRPVTDVYEELWQFSHVTVSLVGRVFFSAVLLSFGMVKDMLPLIIAGLLFLPYHHFMLTTGLGVVLRERRFLGQGLLALLCATLLIMAGGACVALCTEPPIRFQEFGHPLSGLVLSAVIGAAAAFGATDDAGRRELIGLAATAHITVYPAWIGLKLVFGLAAADKLAEHLLTFGINVTSLTVAAGVVFALLGLRGRGIRRFAERKNA